MHARGPFSCISRNHQSMKRIFAVVWLDFNLRPPVRCDQMHRLGRTRGCISTHAPRVRCDPAVCMAVNTATHFNSRTSCEVRPNDFCSYGETPDFNSRTSCEVRRRTYRKKWWMRISTHAPRVRCDDYAYIARDLENISTHAPRVRCDRWACGALQTV